MHTKCPRSLEPFYVASFCTNGSRFFQYFHRPEIICAIAMRFLPYSRMSENFLDGPKGLYENEVHGETGIGRLKTPLPAMRI